MGFLPLITISGIVYKSSSQVGKLEVTPLLAAAHSGHLQAVRILLEGGLNVNERDGTVMLREMVLRIANPVYCNTSIVYYQHHNTALMLAAREGWLDVTLYLLDHGADVQSGNKVIVCIVFYAAVILVGVIFMFVVTVWKHGADHGLRKVSQRSGAVAVGTRRLPGRQEPCEAVLTVLPYR